MKKSTHPVQTSLEQVSNILWEEASKLAATEAEAQQIVDAALAEILASPLNRRLCQLLAAQEVRNSRHTRPLSKPHLRLRRVA